MIELQGKYNTAKVFTDVIDDETASQIIKLLNQDFVKDNQIRIMPDCHKGKGCVIGFTANVGDKVIPNLVGVDVGCGMIAIKLGNVSLNLEVLDGIIHKHVPSGFNIHKNKVAELDKLKKLYCYKSLKNIDRIERSIGTLGGGNHFIEVGVDSKSNKYLIIHSGSRNLGNQVATYYQDVAIKICSGKDNFHTKCNEIINTYKEQGRQKEIQQALTSLKKEYMELQSSYPRELCYLTGEFKDQYLHDMKMCQEYANHNRETMANIILSTMFDQQLDDFYYFHTVHNYISFDDNIIRKGSIAAHRGDTVLIPINMRDGSILARGKGNSDWNYSAPHGAGRIMSRNQARKNITLEEFRKSMKGIYTTSVNRATIDEAPMAYKPIEAIVNNINETVDIVDIIKPIYNFKAG